MRPSAHILIGLPGSGKSTLARRLAELYTPASIVSSDEIRKHLYGDEAIQGEAARVFRFARSNLLAAVRAGRNVIYDATNINPRFRRLTLHELRENGARWIIGYWLDVPLPICQQRNRDRHRIVPDAVLLRMVEELRRSPPSFHEGFDELVITGEAVQICVDAEGR
jgi:predicted kinase